MEVNEVMVRVTSLRLRTFLKSGTKCHCCGMEATHFAIEKDAKTKEPFFHLNLYGTDPVLGEILFTHDHIIALSKGGPDNLSNTQTMCGPCNWRKSDK